MSKTTSQSQKLQKFKKGLFCEEISLSKSGIPWEKLTFLSSDNISWVYTVGNIKKLKTVYFPHKSGVLRVEKVNPFLGLVKLFSELNTKKI